MQPHLAAQLRPVLLQAREMLAALSAPDASRVTELQFIGARLERWVESLEGVLACLETVSPQHKTNGRLADALRGADIDVDVVELSLHDITQLAAALHPGASLTVRSSSLLSPHEQASISTVAPGQVRFL
jgi:hypothetical protein